MQPRRSREQQAFAFQLRAGSHLHKARQMQINRLRPDAAAPGQHGLCPAQPGRQQRGAEQDGCPHPARRAFRQRPAAGHPVHPYIRPSCRSAVQLGLRRRARLSATSASSGTPHSRTGPLHSRDAASNGYTCLGRRDPYLSIQRPPARDDVIPCHEDPRLAKTPMVCRTRAVGSLFCTRTPQNAFVRSFVCLLCLLR